jgi:hypothetical protein
MNIKNRKRILVVALTILLSGCYTLPALAASSSNKTGSSTSNSSSSSSSSSLGNSSGLTQSYNADPSVETGMVVELKPKDPTTVIPLPDTDIQDMLGVVIPQSNATIVLTPQNINQQQVLVASSGHFNVLVSNQNGPIKVGDYITVSAIAGVGMKADTIENEVLGKAAGSFSGTNNVLGTVSLKSTIGKTTNVSISSIPVDVNISHNPLFQKTADYVPSFLAKTAVAIANHPVTASKIYLCMVILFITAVVTGNMLYSGVRSGMIAVGRNPLSKKSIIRSLIQTVIAGLIIFIAGIFAVYLLLKL